MDRQYLYERNLLALSASDPSLCSRLSEAETGRGHYRVLDSRSEEKVPALVDASGAAHPLHSIIDPEREAERLVSTISGEEGFVIFMGLGGGFHIQAALKRKDISRILIIEYNINGIAELLTFREYIDIFNDRRVRLLADPSREEIETYILEEYKPVIYGGIRVIPLRSRVELDDALFEAARSAVKNALDGVSADFSVQAFFGFRWFSNIARNLARAGEQKGMIPPRQHIAIAAAGPSLDGSFGEIREKRAAFFLLAVDTSLPALLAADITPDAVVSIDCQHYSYYHFMSGLPRNIPLFLDLASPPAVASIAEKPVFFSGGHPLSLYISRHWRSFPRLDTSGGNVTHTALSLAGKLGAKKVTLYGADFSYPEGRTYARETYIYPYFRKSENRLAPLEGLFSSFLYRNKLLSKERGPCSWYYETPTLRLYRKRLESLAETLPLDIRNTQGLGAGLDLPLASPQFPALLQTFATGPARETAAAFLHRYGEDIRRLPEARGEISAYLERLTRDEEILLLTLLPAGAALRQRFPALKTTELIGELKARSLSVIEAVLKEETK